MEEEDGFVCLLVCWDNIVFSDCLSVKVIAQHWLRAAPGVLSIHFFFNVGSNGEFTLCVASVRNCSQQLIVFFCFNVLLFKIVYLLAGLKPVHCIKLDLFLAVQWIKTFQHFCLIGDRFSVDNQIKYNFNEHLLAVNSMKQRMLDNKV